MNVIRYNVNSTDACNIGYQYEHNASKVVFSGYAMKDPENEMYFKFMGRTAASRYLIPIVDMTLDITHLLTKNAGTFKCQLEERTAEGDFVGETPVFQVHVGTSIKSNADYEIVDDRLPTLYTKYNEMYNIIHRTNEQAVVNELERQANWETLRTEVRAAIADIDGSLDSYKAETTATLQSELNQYKATTSDDLRNDVAGYKAATDASLQSKFEEYAADSDDSIKDSLEDYKREANMNITNEVLAAKEGLQADIDGKFSSTKAVYDLEIGAVVTDLERKRDNGEFNGKDGHTPEKGVDYFTEADKTEIASKVQPYNDGPIREELNDVKKDLNDKADKSELANVRESLNQIMYNPPKNTGKVFYANGSALYDGFTPTFNRITNHLKTKPTATWGMAGGVQFNNVPSGKYYVSIEITDLASDTTNMQGFAVDHNKSGYAYVSGNKTITKNMLPYYLTFTYNVDAKTNFLCFGLMQGTPTIDFVEYTVSVVDVTNFSDERIDRIDKFTLHYFDDNIAVSYADVSKESIHSLTSDESVYSLGTEIAQTKKATTVMANALDCIYDEWNTNNSLSKNDDGTYDHMARQTYGAIRIKTNKQYALDKKYLLVWKENEYHYQWGSLMSKSYTWAGNSFRSVVVDGVTFRYSILAPNENDRVDYVYIIASVLTVGTTYKFKPIGVYELDLNFDVDDETVKNVIVGGYNLPSTLSSYGSRISALENMASAWNGKNVLVIGDSLTQANVWQNELHNVLGMNVTTHAKGGLGMSQLVDGDGDLSPISTSDVTNKDLIIFYAGYNNRGLVDGNVGDVFNPSDGSNNTISGLTQYVINRLYDTLKSANNLKCRIAIVTPHCGGKYQWIDADGYDEYPIGSGQSARTLAKAMCDVASYNSIPCLNLWETSGINKNTWSVFSASPTPTNTTGGGSSPYPYNNDQLHLNTTVGYPYLGKRIANWVNTI